MALSITIAETDRTKLVVRDTLAINNVLTQQVDTAVFVIKKFGDRTFAPTVGQEVVITLDGTKKFGGRIVQLNEQYSELDVVGYQIVCQDYTRDLDKKLVIESYEDMTVDDIIADIATKYLDSSITLTNVNCPVVVKYVAFNYEYPSRVLKQLADITNYDWYIDYDKDIHFFNKATSSAPFELSDTNGNYIYKTLSIKKDITPVRNTIIVRGGEYKGDPFTVERIGDGTQRVFGTEYKYANLQVSVTGTLKNIGIDNIDDADDYDALHNFQEKFIKFREDKTPSASAGIKIMGNPWLPVIVKLRDNTSIANFSATEGNDGIYEYKIIDKSIKTKEGARQRARAELLRYSSTLVEAEFATLKNGLRAGQQIRVQSDLRGVDMTYVISSIEMVPVGPVVDSTIQFRSKVSLVSTKTFDMIALLQKLLEEKDKEIEINEDEVLDEIETADETVNIGEAITTTSESRNYQWGPGGTPQLRWNLGGWG